MRKLIDMKWKLRAAEKDKKALKEEKDALEKVSGNTILKLFADLQPTCICLTCIIKTNIPLKSGKSSNVRKKVTNYQKYTKFIAIKTFAA